MELRAKKSLGQHFLASPAALAAIIGAAEIASGETVLEIGPGTGILTAALLQAGARVIAVEKDDRAFDLLADKLAPNIADGSLQVLRDDALQTDLTALGLVDGRYKLVANIPYYITGMILERFLERQPRPSSMVILVQKEVAERIVARDGKESILSISVKAFGAPRLVARVPRGAFVPPPTVDSAVIAIDDISATRFDGDSARIRRFFEVLKAGFAHKRKLLRRNLEAVMSSDEIGAAWRAVGLSDTARAEELSIEQWEGIARTTSEHGTISR